MSKTSVAETAPIAASPASALASSLATDLETRPTTRPSAPGRPAKAPTDKGFTPKTLGMVKVVSVFLDDERMQAWTVDGDFRRALNENLADEFPSADKIMIRTYTNAEVSTFAPETYLEETTLEYVRTDEVLPGEVQEIPPVLAEGAVRETKAPNLPALTRTIRIPGAGMRVPNRGGK